MTPRIIAVACSLALAGCYKTNYIAADSSGLEDGTVFHHRVAFGIAELPGPVDVTKYCPSGVAKVHTEVDLITGFVGYVLQPIYQPSLIKIWCLDGSAARLRVDEEGVQELAVSD